MREVVGNHRLWGGRDNLKMPPSSPSGSTSTSTWFLMFTNRGIFGGEKKGGKVNDKFCGIWQCCSQLLTKVTLAAYVL